MKVHLRTLGCRLNQSEIDMMARQLRQQGHEIVDNPTLADQFIVNTCAVTQDAVRSSRKLVRELNRANLAGKITITGCYAQIFPDDVAVLPGVTEVIGNQNKEYLVEKITGVPIEPFDYEPISRDQKSGASGKTRAFVKVQDGCDNACAFCVTTIARGQGRSRSTEKIVAEIRYLHALGYQEVVLTGVHMGSFGHDMSEKNSLEKLMRTILTETDIPRLRLSSLEPWDLLPEFFTLWENPRLCQHLHLPLQSGCNATLKRMLRRTNQIQFRELVYAARENVPEMCITTDIIVGFPGETDDEFSTSLAFIEEMDFAGLHVFRYSKRPGTAGARMRNHVNEDIKKTRSAQLITLSKISEKRFAERFTQHKLPVLWEQVTGATENGFINVGYTNNYIRVVCTHPCVLTNQITLAQMEYFDAFRQQMQAVPVIESMELE